MCGICGVAGAPPGFDLHECVNRMNLTMAHRGPDDQGTWVSTQAPAALGNRRLAVRDLSAAGHMPMLSPDNLLSITFNGEIYNTAELTTALNALGSTVRSHSDTEVVLRGYEAWGEDVVTRLRGMFAFAIVDLRPGRNSLLLARDRLGIKPLYYSLTPNGLLFASEVSALRAVGHVDQTLDPAGLLAYLLLGSLPTPLTFYRHISSLPPASTLKVRLSRPLDPGHPNRYWHLPQPGTCHDTPAEAAARVRELLDTAVSSHLLTDVPLGAFLSGGIDSSALVGLMRESSTSDIRTCSMVFEEETLSEERFSREVARRFQTEHFERVVTAADLDTHWDRILGHLDLPSVDGVNSYFVSQTAREAGITVALSGTGADELFGGYPATFDGIPRLNRMLSLTQLVPGAPYLARAGTHLLPSRHRLAKLRDALSRPTSLSSAYLTRRGLFSPRETRALLEPDWWEAGIRGFAPLPYIETATTDRSALPDVFSWVSRAETNIYMRNQLLRDIDVMSMAHSLEVRVPYLDHHLVEYVSSLSPGVISAGLGPKPLLTASVANLVPPSVSARRHKQGFTLPFDSWLRGPLRARLLDRVSSLPTSGPLRLESAVKVWSLFQAGEIHWSRPWALAVLATFLTDPVAPSRTAARGIPITID